MSHSVCLCCLWVSMFVCLCLYKKWAQKYKNQNRLWTILHLSPTPGGQLLAREDIALSSRPSGPFGLDTALQLQFDTARHKAPQVAIPFNMIPPHTHAHCSSQYGSLRQARLHQRFCSATITIACRQGKVQGTSCYHRPLTFLHASLPVLPPSPSSPPYSDGRE
uniref:Putative secreted protein n=1 Tax=Anopheles darlingi TaxID=43151 RepID=A0A2M4DJ73_ANODA